MPADLVGRARDLAARPEVVEAVDRARDACARLRLHAVTRRRGGEGTAEAAVRGARATALLEGAELGVERVRVLGAVPDVVPAGSADDPVEALVRGALQVTVAASDVATLATSAPAQALARLHAAATARLLPRDQVGRPRLPTEPVGDLGGLGPGSDHPAADLAAVGALLRAGAGQPDLPALVVAALAHGELAGGRPFVLGSGLVGRALERAVLQGRGVDPARLCVPEAGHAAAGTAPYLSALAGYRAGGDEGVVGWVLRCADAVTRGAAEGGAAGDAVLAGRTTP